MAAGRRGAAGRPGRERRVTAWLDIVGIGEDGVAGLGPAARAALTAAETVIGGDRHPDLGPDIAAERLPWPHPFDALIDAIRARRGTRLVILATGDPLWFSVGARIARAIPPTEIAFHPALSAFQWAACRMGWSLADSECLTAHGRPPEAILPHLWPGARLLVLSAGAAIPGRIARLLTARGYGAATIAVLGALGGPDETRHDGVAADWAAADPAADLPAFHTIAIACHGAPDPLLPRTGLPDTAFEHDGSLTPRALRAVVLAHLMPHRGGVLWDIGLGAGSVAIEWMRAAPDAVAIGWEPAPDRAGMARRNAEALGTPRLEIVEAGAPAALAALSAPTGTRPDLRRPDAVHVGGGLGPKTLAAALAALRPGGRLVAAAAGTPEDEALLTAHRGRHGGTLTRLTLEDHGDTGWQAGRSAVLWALVR